MKNIYFLAILLLVPFAFAKDGDCIKTVAGYDPSFEKIDKLRHDQCIITDHLPENSCAYENYRNSKKPKSGKSNERQIDDLTDAVKAKPEDKAAVRAAIKKKIEAHSKSTCFGGKVLAVWKNGGQGSKEKIPQKTAKFECDRKRAEKDPQNDSCGVQTLAHMYDKDDPEVHAKGMKEVEALKEQCRKIKGHTRDCISEAKAKEIFYKYGHEKAVKVSDRMREEVLTTAKYRNEAFMGKPNEKDPNKSSDNQYCEDETTVESRDQGMEISPPCEVTYISKFSDNISNPTLVPKDPAQEQKCKALEGYAATGAKVMTSSSSLDNTGQAQLDHCKKDFLGLSKERNDKTVEALKNSSILPPGIEPTPLYKGENGDGTSGPCAYIITDSSLQEKRDLVGAPDKVLEDSKYARVIVTYTKPIKSSQEKKFSVSAHAKCKYLEMKCDTGK